MANRKFKRKNYKLLIILILFRIYGGKIHSVYFENLLTRESNRTDKKFLKNYINERLETDLKEISNNSLRINIFYRNFYYFKPKNKNKARERALKVINKITHNGRYHILMNIKDISDQEALIRYKKVITYRVKRGNKLIDFKY